MAYIFLNLKRFDISPDKGGVNSLCSIRDWASTIVKGTSSIKDYPKDTFAAFFPEAHLMEAAKAKAESGSPLAIGCQGCYMEDTAKGGNFGAFTSLLTANAASELGASWALIGHCEERKSKAAIIEAGGGSSSVVSSILNKEIKCAQSAGLNVLYCIGESADEVSHWQDVLKAQLTEGLKDTDLSKIAIAYEPIWAIGPGKTPPGRERIQETARFIRSIVDIPVVYGGGLKSDNAEMLASIPEISGGLIALTRFTGDIGFYPDEYLDIVKIYLSNKQ